MKSEKKIIKKKTQKKTEKNPQQIYRIIVTFQSQLFLFNLTEGFNLNMFRWNQSNDFIKIVFDNTPWIVTVNQILISTMTVFSML